MLSEPANTVTPRARSLGGGGAGECVGALCEQVWRDASECERVADRNAALYAGGDRPFSNVAELRSAGLAAVVEMNVDTLAEPVGETEDDVELALGVAVETRWIETADQVRACAERRRHELGRAVFRGHAA